MSQSKTSKSQSYQGHTEEQIAEETHPPPYDASTCHDDQVPGYHNESLSYTDTQDSSTKKQRFLPAGFSSREPLRVTRTRSASQLLEDVSSRRRVPPEHLCRTPRTLPAASSHNPFDDIQIQESGRRSASRRSSMPARSLHRSQLMAGIRHGDHDCHRMHGLSDSRMHAQPALDEHGNPKRNMKSGTMIVGAAVGVLAVAACNIM